MSIDADGAQATSASSRMCKVPSGGPFKDYYEGRSFGVSYLAKAAFNFVRGSYAYFRSTPNAKNNCFSSC